MLRHFDIQRPLPAEQSNQLERRSLPDRLRGGFSQLPARLGGQRLSAHCGQNRAGDVSQGLHVLEPGVRAATIAQDQLRADRNSRFSYCRNRVS